MDISKSVKNSECIGTVIIFSGRLDPNWNIDQSIVNKLKELWNVMEPYHGDLPTPPLLGYRGSYMKCDDTERFVFNKVVTMKRMGRSESRSDKDRKFEKLLLDSAPKGIFPDSILIV